MAQYRLEVQTIQRSAGRSVVAAAAYRSGDRLIDERLAMEFDFGAKGDIEFAAIMAPADAPAAFGDRQTLWNAAEDAEKRKDAVPARELLVSLPHELNFAQRRALVEAFVSEQLVARGMVADVAMHRPGKEGDERNFHAHILVTTRSVGPAGFGKKPAEWWSPKAVREWRSAWAEIQNEHLRRHLGPDAPQVSHLSLSEQGSDREPGVHLGPTASALERKDIASERGQQNRDTNAHNAKRKELRTDFQATADRLVREAPVIAVPVSKLTTEAEQMRARMVTERDRWAAERAALALPKIDSARGLERELLQPARADLAAAKLRLRQTEQRVTKVRQRRLVLVQWIRNPARMIWAKHAELNAIAQARRAMKRAEIAVQVRAAWIASPAGQTYVASRRGPQLDRAADVARQRRTLERKIKRIDKRIEGATRAYNDLRVAQALGQKELQVPSRLPDETRFIREVGGPARAALRRYPAQARALAVERVNRSLGQTIGRGILPGR